MQIKYSITFYGFVTLYVHCQKFNSSYLVKGTLARNLTTCFWSDHTPNIFKRVFLIPCIRQIRMCFSEIKQNRNTF